MLVDEKRERGVGGVESSQSFLRTYCTYVYRYLSISVPQPCQAFYKTPTTLEVQAPQCLTSLGCNDNLDLRLN
jgi:hypothetical protein